MTDTKLPEATVPSQVAHPGAAVKRTSLASAIASGLGVAVLAPEIINVVLEEAGESMPGEIRVWLIGVGAAVVIGTATVTRIMAMPKVNELLSKINLGATSSKGRHRR